MTKQDERIEGQWQSVANTWRASSSEVSPPSGLTERALERGWPVGQQTRVQLVSRLAIGLGAITLMGILLVLNQPHQQRPDYLAMEPMRPVPAHQLRFHDPNSVCREPESCLPRGMTLQLEQPRSIGANAIDG